MTFHNKNCTHIFIMTFYDKNEMEVQRSKVNFDVHAVDTFVSLSQLFDFFLPIILFRISQNILLLFLKINPIILKNIQESSTII